MNEYQQYYGQQFAPQQFGELAPQGFLGGLFGAPLGGLIGRGIGGLFGNANLGRQIGQAAGGIGGGLLPFGADPLSAAYAQQAQQQQQQQLLQQLLQQGQQGQAGQLAPQGWFGNILKSVARPIGGAVGGIFGNAGLGNTIGGIAGHLGGMLPFAADPVAQAYAQQEALAQQQGLTPQGWLGDIMRKYRPYTGIISPTFPTPPNLTPFGADPVSQAYAQQAQQAQLQQLQQLQQIQQLQQMQQLQEQGLAPQGWFGNILKSVARPIGGAVGGIFGNAGLGNTIGGIAGQLGGMLPFDVDPVTAAYAQQQAQLAQLVAQQGNTALYGGQTLH